MTNQYYYSSSLTVFDIQSRPRELAEMLARGGEGAVYPLLQKPDVLVKWYHPEHLQKRSTMLQQKVEAMAGLKNEFRNLSVSWPAISVYDENKQWIGYAMKRADGLPMSHLAHAMRYQKHFPMLDREGIVGYLIHLIITIQGLHQRGVFIGDYNLNNILCTPGREEITLIDCDSYQLLYQQKHYPCPVGSPDLTPKEHHGQNFSELVRTPESEAFSLAIVLFQCLMLGRHPYDIQQGADPVSNLKRGDFAYGTGNRGIPKGQWYNIWSHMPYRLKHLFITTFTEGADEPSKRATLAQWLEALLLYRKEMKKGWHELAIKPAEPKSKDYRGSQSVTDS